MMVGCFGPYAYKQHIEAIVAAEAQCMGETFNMDHLPQDHGPHHGYGKQVRNLRSTCPKTAKDYLGIS